MENPNQVLNSNLATKNSIVKKTLSIKRTVEDGKE